LHHRDSRRRRLLVHVGGRQSARTHRLACLEYVVPPAMWFHEHFNTSVEPVRFLAFHPPGMLAYPGWSGEGEHFIGKGPNQIEYEDEDPEIRKTFEYELGKNGLVSRMPRELYENRKAS